MSDGRHTVAAMPESPADRAILEQRARQLARLHEQGDLDAERRLYVRFRLGPAEHYGIPYEYCEGVVPAAMIASVPCTRAFVRGVINHRGEMLAVLDLKQLLHIDGDACGEPQVILVRDQAVTAGIYVDEIIGSDEYIPSQLAAPLPTDSTINLDYIKGIYQGRVAVLDPVAILGDPAITENHATESVD